MTDTTDTPPGTAPVLRRRQDGMLDLVVITGFMVGLLADSAPTLKLSYFEPVDTELTVASANSVRDIQLMLSPMQAKQLARSLLDAADKSIV